MQSDSSSKVGTYGLLAKVELKTLQSIKIAIRRSNIPNPSKSLLKRSLDSPESLKVHLSGSRGRCLFDREDVIVNTVELQEEESDRNERCRSKERYRSRSSSPKKYKSSKIFKNYVNGPPDGYYREEEEKYGKVYPSTSKDYGRMRSVSPRDKRDRSVEKYRKRSRERSFSDRSPPERYRRRSPSYDYKSKYRQDSPKKDEKRRSKSPYPGSKKKYYYRRSVSPPLRPGEYRPKRDSKSPKYKQEEYKRKEYRESYRRVSRTPSPKYNKGSPYPRSKHSRSPETSKSRRKYSPQFHSASTSRRRSRTPLRPGEYRPRRSQSPPLRLGEYRPSKSKSSPEQRPEKYERSYQGIYDYSDFGPMVRPPFMPRFIPRGMLRPGQIFVPVPHFIPVPHIAPIRSQMIRPPKVYNNRPIPRLVSPPRTTNTQSTSTSEVEKVKEKATSEEKNDGKEDKKE